MGNKTKFGDAHLSKPYQSGQFCNFIDDAIVSRPCCPLLPIQYVSKISNPCSYIYIESFSKSMKIKNYFCSSCMRGYLNFPFLQEQ